MADPLTESQLDRATDPEYAAICTTAVIGMILSVLGVAAFVAAPLVAVPFLGIIVSLAALRKIRRSRGVLTGGRLAIGGIVAGVLMALAAGGYHGAVAYREHQVLASLESRSYGIVDAIVAGRYREAFDALADDAPQRQTGYPAFEKDVTALFSGGGNLVHRTCTLLRVLTTEKGETVAPAEVEVRFERRILTVSVWFRLDPDGQWVVSGTGGQETFESVTRFGAAPPPPESPPPEPPE